MSIATQITALQADKTAIANAITAKGGSVAAGDGFDDFATDIGTIPSGTPTQTKTMTLGASAPSTVTPDSGYTLSSVTPSIDTSVIKAENIAQGATILGIEGTHQGGTPQPQKGGLCFTANTAGSTVAGLIVGNLPFLSMTYSRNEETWADFIPGTTVITLANAGDKVYFRGDNRWISTSPQNYFRFVMSGSISASGNIQSLLDASLTSVAVPSYCYNYLFHKCTVLTTAPTLPATQLSDYCYSSMFSSCTSLTTAPALPATQTGRYCYTNMFNDCTSLTTAPALPANNIDYGCYSNMFSGCTSLVTAPTLPATQLSDYCYNYMFMGCASLTTAPALPATQISKYCYSNMLQNCTSLTTAPALPATQLSDSCYNCMFIGCTSLTTAPALPATQMKTGCYNTMFRGCTSLTTAPALPATQLASNCYTTMFQYCTSLTTAPALPATQLISGCYTGMFQGCTALQVYSSSGSGHTRQWRIPTSGTASGSSTSQSNVFKDTTGDYASTASINFATTYTFYTQNTPRT